VRALVVVNPQATATTERQRDVLAHALGSLAELNVEQTRHRGHAAALACRAMRDGVDLVVALGGDGTVNEVVNGLLTDGVHEGVPALGVVPTGSTNVFARALALPNDPVEATGILLDAVRRNRRRPVSMGRADERWFIFAAGVGFDAGLIARVERYRGRGRASTDALYARAGIREFFGSDRRHPLLHIDLPDGTTMDGLHLAIIANTDPWTFIGRRALRPTPDASFDGGLDVYARTRMGSLGVLYAISQMARRRPPSSGRGAVVMHDLPHFVLRADEPMLLQVDGDLIGPQQSVEFRSFLTAIDVML
jgi:diacylglycerol kinase family enzyme